MSQLHRIKQGAALCLACALTPACSPAALAGKTHVETLAKRTSSWNDVPYQEYPSGTPELTVMKITIPAHSALPWHTHVMPNAAYVLSGALTVEDRVTGRTQRYVAGTAFTESVGSVHRGSTGAEAAVVIVTYAGVPGAPLSTPVDPESGEGH